MARRFIVDQKDIKYFSKEENLMEIKGKEVKHIQVLRHDVGDMIIVNDYVCKIKRMHSISIELEIVSEARKQGEPKINLTLYIALLKGDKMDLVIQKAVELGVKTIVPFISKNVVVKLDEKGKHKRREKLQIIANEACKQCGRTDTVEIKSIIDIKELVSLMSLQDINIFAYENEKESIHDTLDKIKKKEYKNISIIIGAEGGFDQSEAKLLKEIDKVECISLGTRILRAETAAISLISIVMYEMDK